MIRAQREGEKKKREDINKDEKRVSEEIINIYELLRFPLFVPHCCSPLVPFGWCKEEETHYGL
jgi:hypothetical protein